MEKYRTSPTRTGTKTVRKAASSAGSNVGYQRLEGGVEQRRMDAVLGDLDARIQVQSRNNLSRASPQAANTLKRRAVLQPVLTQSVVEPFCLEVFPTPRFESLASPRVQSPWVQWARYVPWHGESNRSRRLAPG